MKTVIYKHTNKYIKKTILLSILLLCSIVMYCLDFSLTDPIPIDENILIGQLDNGLSYYIRRNSIPENEASLMLVMRVGAINEDNDQLGLAHFLEHMAFNGTENFPDRSVRDYLNSIGRGIGFITGSNGMTGINRSVYILNTNTDDVVQFDKAFLILSDWSGRINLETSGIDAERGIILEEMRERRGVRDRMWREVSEILYEGSIFSNRLPIGTEEVIMNFEHQRLRDFYHDWYRPDLQAVIAVGDFDIYEVREKIVKHFDFSKRVNTRPIPDTYIPHHDNTRFGIVIDPEATQNIVRIAHKHPLIPIKSLEDYRENLISELMAYMLMNRFIEVERQANSPFMNPWAWFESRQFYVSTFNLIAYVNEENIVNGLQTLITELERAKQHGFHESELERAKNSFISYYRNQYQNRNVNRSRELVTIYENHFIYGTPIMNIEFEYKLINMLLGPHDLNSQLRSITLTDIQNILVAKATENNRAVLITGTDCINTEHICESEILALFPYIQGKELDVFPELIINQPLIENMPQKRRLTRRERARYDDELGVYTWRLRNGAVVHLKTTDFRSDEIVFFAQRSGGLSQAEDEVFLSSRAIASIIGRSGLGNFSRSQLDNYLAGKNVDLTMIFGSRSELLDGSSSVEDFETLMQLLWLKFTDLKLDEEVFDTWLSNMNISLTNQARSPDFLYSEEINNMRYDNHLRTRTLIAEDLTDICYKTGFDFVRSRFDSVNGFHFVFAGNICKEDLQNYIEMYIAPLPGHKVDTTVVDRNLRFSRNSERRHVYHGQEQDNRTLVSIMFTNDVESDNIRQRTIIGVFFSMLREMLLETMRGEMSGIYHVNVTPTNLPILNNEVVITIGFGCAPERVDEMIEVIISHVKMLQNNEFEERFLTNHVTTAIPAFEQLMRTNRFWRQGIADVSLWGERHEDRLNQLGIIQSLTREDIVDIVNKIIDFYNMQIVVLFPEDMRE